MKKYDFVFFVSTLGVHGGTTFVKRFSSYANLQSKRILVFCLVDNDIDKDMLGELQKVADVLYLRDYVKYPFFTKRSNQLSIFLPLNLEALARLLYGSHIHVMGVFGLYLLIRLESVLCKSSSSVGLYQQYEFEFSGKIKWYFLDTIKRYLKLIDPRRLVFFNEPSAIKFCSKFSLEQNMSLVTPIGIDIVEYNERAPNLREPKIVSIGNLVKFKTYNILMINLMPSLIERFGNIHYHIVGCGPELRLLQELSESLEVTNNVTFHGVKPFSEAFEMLNDADIFVGSGTAILEAAIRGTPSIIGIEGMLKPMTYGFIYQVESLAYNEKSESQELVNIIDCIHNVLVSEEKWSECSVLCAKKARTFSVERTYNDFFIMVDLQQQVENRKFEFSNIRCLFSFFQIAILDALHIDRSFRFRRNND